MGGARGARLLPAAAPIHPVNVRVGGFYSVPDRADLAPVAGRLRQALDAALDTVRWAAGFDFPDLELDCDLLALSDPGRYPIERGEVRWCAQPGEARSDDEYGRGMAIVAALADKFGHDISATGQTVWAEAGWLGTQHHPRSDPSVDLS